MVVGQSSADLTPAEYSVQALTVEVPIWIVLFLLPFAWDFLANEDEGYYSKGDAYAYVATLLLAVVAHRGTVSVRTCAFFVSVCAIDGLLRQAPCKGLQRRSF